MSTLERIRTELERVVQSHGDKRLHHCQLTATALEQNACLLSGSVLDDATRVAVIDVLASRFPEIDFDTRELRVLRPGRMVMVATTVTSLHAEPSFLSEMVSQLLNGRQVEVLLERDRWAYVRLADGYLGWAYRSYLSGAPAPDPTHIVCEPFSPLYGAPDAAAAVVSRAAVGTAVLVAAQVDGWARLALAGGLEGWVPLGDLRALGSQPIDDGVRRRQMVRDAGRLTGVPYLWGGCTASAIDCSGMVQLLHRLAGRTIPRDADMQFEAGRLVEPPFRPGDLLFFGSEGARRSITHVGMSVGGWRIVHASRARNGVYEDDVQSVPRLRESFVGARTFLV